MGSYLIPGAHSVSEAADWLNDGLVHRWQPEETGLRFLDKVLDDAACEALFVGYVPSGMTDDEYQRPLPAALETHRQHLLDFVDAVDAGTDGSLTTAQLRHVLRDAVKGLFYLNKRLEDG